MSSRITSLSEAALIELQGSKVEKRENCEWVVFKISDNTVEYFEITSSSGDYFDVAHHKVVSYGEEVEAFTLVTFRGQLLQLIPLMVDIYNRSKVP